MDEIRRALAEGRDGDVAVMVRDALEGGADAGEILDGALISAMEGVGERFRSREIFLPEVLLAARAMKAGLEVLRPRLEEGRIRGRGTIVIGTMQGDIHDIGKNLVGIMLRGAGYEVVDLGNDVPPERFVEAAREHGAGVVGLSALLTTTMQGMRRVVEALKDSGLGQVRVIVGGAPVSEAFAREIGADGWAPDAATAVDRLRAWDERE